MLKFMPGRGGWRRASPPLPTSGSKRKTALRASDGSLVTDKDGLCDVFRSFYLDLFSAVPCDSNACAELLSNISSVLPFYDSEVCEGLLSQEEYFVALQGMARGKAPGCDGLPMEFYLKFWHVLGFDLVCVLNSAFGLGPLSRSQRRGIITLSWDHPISLLNVDYKIASGSIAARLLNVIHLVVNKDQSCGVPGRFIGENVAFLWMLLIFVLLRGLLLLFFLLIKKKHSTGLIGRSYVLPYMQWVLGSLLLGGLICFIIMLVVV